VQDSPGLQRLPSFSEKSSAQIVALTFAIGGSSFLKASRFDGRSMTWTSRVISVVRLSKIVKKALKEMSLPTMARHLIAAFLLFAVVGCAEQVDVTAAISSFHGSYDREDYLGIYETADDRFRKKTTASDLSQALGDFREKLGLYQKGEQQKLRVNWKLSGKFVDCVYSSEFENGYAQEFFTFRMVDGKAILVGYSTRNVRFR
jgi:hypothetical protein